MYSTLYQNQSGQAKTKEALCLNSSLRAGIGLCGERGEKRVWKPEKPSQTWGYFIEKLLLQGKSEVCRARSQDEGSKPPRQGKTRV